MSGQIQKELERIGVVGIISYRELNENAIVFCDDYSEVVVAKNDVVGFLSSIPTATVVYQLHSAECFWREAGEYKRAKIGIFKDDGLSELCGFLNKKLTVGFKEDYDLVVFWQPCIEEMRKVAQNKIGAGSGPDNHMRVLADQANQLIWVYENPGICQDCNQPYKKCDC